LNNRAANTLYGLDYAVKILPNQIVRRIAPPDLLLHAPAINLGPLVRKLSDQIVNGKKDIVPNYEEIVEELSSIYAEKRNETVATREEFREELLVSLESLCNYVVAV